MTINKGNVVVETEEFVLDYIKHYETLLKYTKQSVKRNRIKKGIELVENRINKIKVIRIPQI